MSDTKGKYERGCERAREVIGEIEYRKLIDDYGSTPHLSSFVLENIWGDLFCRDEVLALREREMVTVATLAALGDCYAPLKVHIHGALTAGVKPTEIAEIISQVAGLAGVPRALRAAHAVREVFEERGITVTPASPE